MTLAHAPPAITGGTLLLTARGQRAVASDPDRDLLYVVDLGGPRVEATIRLEPGDEPGRLVEDGRGRVHVALRRGGAVVTLDLATRKIVDRRRVCAAPRGIAYDAVTDDLFVACNGGELVTLPAPGGSPTRTWTLATDLRDVVVDSSGGLYVSTFRKAEVLAIDDHGNVTAVGLPPSSRSKMEPDIAWRMIAMPGIAGTDPIAMVHQLARPTPVRVTSGGYGQSGGCPETSIIETTVTTFQGTWTSGQAVVVPGAVLPVDVAASPDGHTFAVVAAGNAKTPNLPSIFFVPTAARGQIIDDGAGCAAGVTRAPVPGQATAVAFAGPNVAWVQTREPAALVQMTANASGTIDMTASVALSSESREDTGHSIVHSNSGAFIACASCHAEGGEDGRTWQFSAAGGLTPRRRTQSLRGTLDGTAPYHWEGDMADVDALAHEVFVKRMDGPTLTDDQTAALQKWLFAVPRPVTSPSRNAASAARGAKLFHRADVGCTLCHVGERLTNNLTMDVGTGGFFQVPSLVGVGWRAPYMHDGRAPQLVDRFNPALAGALHGQTFQLSTSEIDDLVDYLETL